MIKPDPQFRRADANDAVRSKFRKVHKIRCQEREKRIARSKGYLQSRLRIRQLCFLAGELSVVAQASQHDSSARATYADVADASYFGQRATSVIVVREIIMVDFFVFRGVVGIKGRRVE